MRYEIDQEHDFLLLVIRDGDGFGSEIGGDYLVEAIVNNMTDSVLPRLLLLHGSVDMPQMDKSLFK